MLRCSTLIIQWKCVFWKLTLKLSCFKLSRWFLSKTNEMTQEKRQLLHVNGPKRLFKFVSTGSNTYFGGNLHVCSSSVSFHSYLRITTVQLKFFQVLILAMIRTHIERLPTQIALHGQLILSGCRTLEF